MAEQEWPAEILLGRVQRFGDVEYFDVPVDDADEYETEAYVPAERVALLEEALENLVADFKKRAERAGALSRYGIDSDATNGEELAFDKAAALLTALLNPKEEEVQGG